MKKNLYHFFKLWWRFKEYKLENQETFVLEIIKVLRPTNKNHIFNETDYDIVVTTDSDGAKLVILRNKTT